jgi:hypothetical protein
MTLGTERRGIEHLRRPIDVVTSDLAPCPRHGQADGEISTRQKEKAGAAEFTARWMAERGS